MSIRTVSAQIRTAARDHVITAAEATSIVTDAERGPVTVGEARAVRELFERQPVRGSGVPLPSDVIIETGAKNVLETFFSRHDIPAGKNLQKYVERIEASLENGYGSALSTAPDTKKLHMVRLPYPKNVADFPSRTAFLDPKKNEFYLCVAGGLMAPGPASTHWYGPIALADAPAPRTDLTPERTDRLHQAFSTANVAGTLAWKPGSVMQGHLGERFVRVELMRERHPDGYAYAALVPVGALSPTAKTLDPNKVNEFYLERTGGFAGLTSSVGPLTLS